jgi:hypothetical protein
MVVIMVTLVVGWWRWCSGDCGDRGGDVTDDEKKANILQERATFSLHKV